MLQNYLKIAWRNLTRNKAFSFINIFGLAIGLATCLLIMLYVIDEKSYDQHHTDGERIYRIASVSSSGGKSETWAAVAAPIAGGIQAGLPETEQITRVLTFPDIATMLMRYNTKSGNKEFFEPGGLYVDSTFFNVFTYDFIHGNANTALAKPNSLVVSATMAEKYFGPGNPVGNIITINTPFGEMNYTVTGVYNETRYKSHIAANYFLSMRNNDMWNWVQRQTGWTNNNVFFTYVKIKRNTDAGVFAKKLTALFNQHAAVEAKKAGFSKQLFLQPLKDIYLHSALGNEIGANGNITYLYILASIGLFILLIACINFMNLSTARSQKRAREVGVRKVMGAEKASLVRQFLGESFLMCLIALMLALLISWLLLPAFNEFTQKHIQPFDKPALLYGIAGLALLTGFLAGLYPAFYLSAFAPVAVLKGTVRNSFSATAIRKGLVVFQFTISICLVLGAVVVWKQLDLLKNQHLGFNKEQQLILPLQQAFRNSEKDYTVLKNELAAIPGITSISSGSAYPGIANLNDMLFYPEGKTVNDVVDVRLAGANTGFIETLGFTLISGRSFSADFKADSASIILNETAVKDLGYTAATALGKQIQYDYAGHHTMQIIGVLKDFNFQSLHNAIKPFGFTSGLFSNKYGYLVATVKGSDYRRLIQSVEQVWAKLNPGIPFMYSFIDQDFQRNYQKEQHSSRIIVSFTIIAILIACLGLFGLAAFAAEQRTKEIGIRKVLGASVADVIKLLSGEFIKLVFVAMVIASPIAWYCMRKWLQDFAYRATISWWMFAGAGLLAIGIALITVSFQAIKAATANPVNSLRSE